MAAITIAAVPESIERSAYIALIESLGVNPADMKSMTFGLNWITVEVVARDTEGHFMVDEFDNVLVRHRIAIPVTDPIKAQVSVTEAPSAD